MPRQNPVHLVFERIHRRFLLVKLRRDLRRSPLFRSPAPEPELPALGTPDGVSRFYPSLVDCVDAGEPTGPLSTLVQSRRRFMTQYQA
ncbi:hypothetical protein BJY04DRAFT_217359 [Aspergillus karnatakaensis]|uniref:uncharacterized protein n=1 Tax=Aspergillus karnatakaensis TaxID=1810916 RepID=UPI003CCE015E